MTMKIQQRQGSNGKWEDVTSDYLIKNLAYECASTNKSTVLAVLQALYRGEEFAARNPAEWLEENLLWVRGYSEVLRHEIMLLNELSAGARSLAETGDIDPAM